MVGLAHALFTNAFDANLVDDSIAGTRRVRCRNRGRAVQEPRNVRRVTELGVKTERRLVGHPASGLWLELTLQIGTNVEVTRAWTTTQPLDRSASREVDV